MESVVKIDYAEEFLPSMLNCLKLIDKLNLKPSFGSGKRDLDP